MRGVMKVGSLLLAVGVFGAVEARTEDVRAEDVRAQGAAEKAKAGDKSMGLGKSKGGDHGAAPDKAMKPHEMAEKRKEKMLERGQAGEHEGAMDESGKMRPKPHTQGGKVERLDHHSHELRQRAVHLALVKDKKGLEELTIERQALRQELRKARHQQMNKRWGRLLTSDPALAEVKQHARRMARLDRARALAEEHKKDKLLTRIDELVAKEEARHEAKMTELKKAQPDAMPASTEPMPEPATGEPAAATPEGASNAPANDPPANDEGAE